MGIELIHSDGDFHELEEITVFTRFDAQLSAENPDDNDWMIELPEKAWERFPLEKGHYLYIPGTEWGGPVERISHIGKDGVVRVYGSCWRGLLARKVICPPPGETHFIISSAEANAALAELAGRWNENIFSVSSNNSGIICSASLRYRTLLSAVYILLGTAGTLDICFSDGKARLECVPVRDLSESVELSQEYNAIVSSESSSRKYNHIIALGRGEMLDRTILELWLLPDGSVTGDPDAEGIPGDTELSTLLYDYPAVESESDLRSAAVSKLKNSGGNESMTLELNNYDGSLKLGDIVSVKDRLTGMTARLGITGIDLRITPDGLTLTYSSGTT